MQQRLGFAYPTPTESPVWLHAASVGEVNAALPLINLLSNRPSTKTLLLSCNTATAYRRLQQQFANHSHIQLCFLPFDFGFAIRRFLKKIQPKALLLIETEIWPNLYRLCYGENIPIVIINGRISQKTLQAPAWFKPIIEQSLQQLTAILARSQNDADNFLTLGAHPSQVQRVGNIKYASNTTEKTNTTPPLARPFILAASTHDDEELQLATAWQALQKDFAKQNMLLLIAPRHPERRERIQQQLSTLGFNIALRSQQDSVTEHTDIYLLDTLGELSTFMPHAELVFIGGSLIPRGGQNVLEPARFGKAILTGMHMYNFAEETQDLLNCGALLQVTDRYALESVLRALLDDTDQLQQMGQKALALIHQQEDVAMRYLMLLINLNIID